LKLKLVMTPFLLLLIGTHVQAQNSSEKLRTRARSIEPFIVAAATRYGVDAHLLWTIAYLESRFQPKAISYKDGRPCAFGLMQFVPATARQYGLRNPYNPREAIDAAARYIRDLLNRFDGRGDLVLAAYNAGEGTVEAYRQGRRLVLPNGKVINPNAIRTGGIPPYAETQAYVGRGMLLYQNLVHQLPNNPRIDFQGGQSGTSIYTSNLGSSLRPIRKSKGSEKKEVTRAPLSLYAN
jgi:soluble lytic murein transglycosylase-like protein